MDCQRYPITPEWKVVAIATDKYLKPTYAFADPSLPAPYVPKYGQDITFGMKRPAPGGHNVGSNEADLKKKMEKLLEIFASNDASGMARRLFNAFLKKQPKVTYFDDTSLDAAAASHPNIRSFGGSALNAPGFRQTAGKTRIHQALKAANWDIKQMIIPTDLGVPAFNKGSKWTVSGDFGNGLGVMINGVQHVYVSASHYHYDPSANKYCIQLHFVFYDVFGLDDDDLDEYGAESDSWTSRIPAVGITAWWQLQHQFGYAPLVTRIRTRHDFIEVSTV